MPVEEECLAAACDVSARKTEGSPGLCIWVANAVFDFKAFCVVIMIPPMNQRNFCLDDKETHKHEQSLASSISFAERQKEILSETKEEMHSGAK